MVIVRAANDPSVLTITEKPQLVLSYLRDYYIRHFDKPADLL